MKRYLLLILFVLTVFYLFSQNFPPPEELSVDECAAKLMWEPPSIMKMTDKLYNYNPGDYWAVVSPNWTTWSNQPGSNEDALIDNYLYGFNLAKIENETNMITEVDSTYTSGRFSFHIGLYIPEDHCGYFNLQKTNIPGEEFGFEVFFGADTTATINAGGEATLQFPYWNNRLQEFNMIIDIDNDWAEFYFDTYLLIDYQWSLGTTGEPGLNSLGGVNISTEVLPGIVNTPLFYIFEVNFRKQFTSIDGLSGYNVYLDGEIWDFLNSPQIQQYYYQGLTLGETYLAGVSSIFDNPAGESEISSYNFTYLMSGVFPFPPENVEVVVQNYNEATLTWQHPFWVLLNLYGYHIYRNNVFVHRVLGPNILTLTDYPLPEGNYEYYLKGIYLNDPDYWLDSNIAACTIEFPIPENVIATSMGQDVLLEWTLEPPYRQQRDLIGFNVYRDNEIIADNIAEYSYLDENLPSGNYTYNIAAVFSGNHESEWSDDVIAQHLDINQQLNRPEFSLSNYPNPFNPSTTISFSLTTENTGLRNATPRQAEDTEIMIYNLKGQKVKTVPIPESQSHTVSIVWDGTDDNNKPVSSGVYFYKLKSDEIEITRKCLLLK